MKKIRFTLLLLLIGNAIAQPATSLLPASELPPCVGNVSTWLNCFGTHKDLLGITYVGEFKDALPNGLGAITYKAGYKYIGEFKAGRYEGLGISLSADGSVIAEGVFSNDIFIKREDVKSFFNKQKQVKENKEREAYLIKEFQKSINATNTSSDWIARVNNAVGSLLLNWFEEQTNTNKIIAEIKPPEFPAAINLTQEKWETNKEFEDRIGNSRFVRQQEIDRIQTDYKNRVESRNSEIQKLAQLRLEKEKLIPVKKKELVKQALEFINLKVEAKNVLLDQESGILFVDASIDNGVVERFAFKDVPQQIRRNALTSLSSQALKPEFFVSESGQFGIKAINIQSGDVKVSGTPSQSSAGSQALRLATIDVPVTNFPVLTQQSVITVDKNQVEQILYRDENDSLRKRLEEQRKSQELALAAETQKVAAETAKLRSEAETAKNRQRELETQLASSSRTPVNYGKALNAHALIIGNASYAGNSKLPNPINDAKAMSGMLRGLGFTISESLDTDRAKMVSALSQFSKTAANADISLLFYAGHGVQISGTNYMLPIDLNLNDLAQVPLQGVSLNSVVEQYLPGKTKLVFLDACRDNPLIQTASRSVSRGLAPISVSEGTLISYSTKDGQVAQDGEGKNSPFTTALLQHLGDPDDIAVVLRKVRESVLKNTGGKQQPWEYGSLTGGALVLSAIKPR